MKKNRAYTELKNIDEKAIYLGESVHGASVMATDASGLTVVCSITNGNIFGTGKEVSSLGFYLAEALDETKISSTTFNMIKTDIKKKEPHYAFSAIGDYALRDGLILTQENLLNNKSLRQSTMSAQKQLPDDRKEILKNSPVFSCVQGSLSAAQTCQHNECIIAFKGDKK